MSEIKRVLAEVVRITEKCAIEGADMIELVKVRGWQVVVQKGLHSVGDLVVYFSIDALLPELPEFEFLRDRCFVKDSQEGPGFRIKTIKLRGEVSQGLLIPIRELSGFTEKDVANLKDGQDVTDLLNVKKFEKVLPAHLKGNARGNFPSWLRKTDEERIQNFIGRFNKSYRDHVWEVTLKYDGSSMTTYFNARLPHTPPRTKLQKIFRFVKNLLGVKESGRFGVASRNIDLTETKGNTFWDTARKLDLETKLRKYHEDTGLSIALQGELMGPGIQGNRENFKDHDYFVFNVWDIDNQRYFAPAERQAFLKEYGIKEAKSYGDWSFVGYTTEDFLKLADTGYDGKSINHPIREGLVFKSKTDSNVSFKAISNRFLLKEKD